MTEKRRRLSAQERRAQILDAARAVFLERGFAGTRTKDIAGEAGITEAFLFRFFPTKQAIYEAAVLDPMRELVSELAAATTRMSDSDGKATLLQVNRMLARFMRESAPFLATVWLRDLTQGRTFYENELRPLLAGPVTEVVAKISGWHPPAGDRSLVFGAMVGSHIGLAMDSLLREEDFEAQRLGDQLTELFSVGMPEDVQQAVVRF